MKVYTTALLVVSLMTLKTHTGWASWLIEVERYHLSVHGELSCQDCHGDIQAKIRHPDPANVNKLLAEPFDPQKCGACHDDVLDQIVDGSHAGQEATRWQQFDNCLECHNPHEQLSSSGDLTVADVRLPAEQLCRLCHEYRSELPSFSDEDQACLHCHRAFQIDDPENRARVAGICLHCHAANRSALDSLYESHPLIDIKQYAKTAHGKVACTVCHPQSLSNNHVNQPLGDCRRCHLPHDEKVAHDAHTGVACGACHLDGTIPTKNRETGMVGWRRPAAKDRISRIHQMKIPAVDDSCRSCHNSDNSVGAAAMVLPAKSILCMPCHAATLSVGDPVTAVSSILALFGLTAVGSVWFSAGGQNSAASRKFFETLISALKRLFSARLLKIIKILILDGLLQRRLYAVSKERWLVHALVFYPMIFRFLWGMAALCASLWLPGRPLTAVLLDKNNPWTAFLFDFSGMMVITGIAFMVGRRLTDGNRGAISGLPPADWPAHALFGGIVLVGFVLEGMRIAMTAGPGGAGFAFIGDAVSRLFYNRNLISAYGYIWYLHAGLTGAFLVYLPFSRLFHIIMAPVSLAISAARGSD